MRRLGALLLWAAVLFAQDDAALLQEARDRLETLKGQESAEATRWREVVQRRIALLEEQAETARARGQLIDEAAIASRRAAAEAELERLRNRPVEPPAVASKEELNAFVQAEQEAQTAVRGAEAALADLAQRQKRLQDEVAALPARLAEARRKAEAEQESVGEQLDAYLRVNHELEARVAQSRLDYAREALARWVLRLPMHEAERDLARRLEARAQARTTQARERFAKALQEQARTEKEDATAARERARQENDPLERFRQTALAEALQVAAARRSDEAFQAVLDERMAKQKSALDLLKVEQERLAARFEVRGGVSERVGTLLLSALDRFRRSRDYLERTSLPQLYRDSAIYRTAHAETQDRLWELEVPIEENAVWNRLLEAVGAERTDEARAVFSEVVRGKEGLLATLRARATLLDAVNAQLVAVEQHYYQRIAELDRLSKFVLGRIYWVRNELPVDGGTFTGAARELREVHRVFYGSAGAFRLIAALVVLIGLLAGGFVAARRFGAERARWRSRGSPFWKGAQRTLGAMVITGVVPLFLVLGALTLGFLGLAPAIEEASRRFLMRLAGLWFLRGFTMRFLRVNGIGVQVFRLPSAVAAQLRRSVGIATLVALVAWLPAAVYREPPYHGIHLPRLLHTLFLGAMAVALVLLVRPRGALLRSATGGTGFWYRATTVLFPATALGLAGIVAMDVLGYRVGSAFLFGNVIRTAVAILLLVGLYQALKRVIAGLAARARARAAAETGHAEAHAVSQAVINQLTRVVGALLVAATAMLLAAFWELDIGLRAGLESVHLADVTGGWLTLWDVGVALLWIVGGHFLVSNLSGVYEWLVFPLIGGQDTGGRYVLLALSRYAILLVAYSAALLALHFSFASLGWLLAAASVGLGFGLQEIVANFVSGLILLLERPIRVGDIITVGDTGGVVDRINIRATVVTNWDRQVIIVPNKNFITQNLTNWTRNDTVMRRRVAVGVSYGSDVKKVLEILTDLVASHPKVVADPPPRVWFENFGESSLDFELWFFTPISDGKQVTTDVRSEIHARFAAEGIEIPFPQRDLHVRSADGLDAAAALLERRAQEAR